MKYLIALYVLLISAAAVGAEPPGANIDPAVAGSGLIDALASSQWTLVIGFGVMLLVWVLRVFVWKSLPAAALPYLAVGLASLAAVSTALVAQPAAWLTAIFAGVQAGLGAAGTWGLTKVVRNR